MKQLRNPAVIVALIFVVSLITSYYQAWVSGKLVHWTDFRAGFGDFTVHAVMTTVGWFFFRSPWAAQISEFSGEKTTTAPSGAVTKESTKVTVSVSPADPPVEKDPTAAGMS